MSKSIPIDNDAGKATNINPGKTWYVAGPMSGMERLNRPAFYEAAANLRKAGHRAVNPFELGVDDGQEIRDYMKVDLPAMLECDGVALLRGWEKSQGARLEALVAFECGLDVRTVRCAIYHGFLDPPMAGPDRAADPCSVTRNDVLKAFGVPPPTAAEFAAAFVAARRENVLDEAQRLTSLDRQGDYGHPVDHFARTIGAINAIFKHKLRVPFEVSDWPLILALDKISRQSNKHKRDNLTDIAGYARTAEMVHEKMGEVKS